MKVKLIFVLLNKRQNCKSKVLHDSSFEVVPLYIENEATRHVEDLVAYNDLILVKKEEIRVTLAEVYVD